jgi:hypothetical protein
MNIYVHNGYPILTSDEFIQMGENVSFHELRIWTYVRDLTPKVRAST